MYSREDGFSYFFRASVLVRRVLLFGFSKNLPCSYYPQQTSKMTNKKLIELHPRSVTLVSYTGIGPPGAPAILPRAVKGLNSSILIESRYLQT